MQKTMEAFKDYLEEGQVIYLEDIREGNPQAFTRKRKTTPYTLMLQMFAQKGHSRFSELLNFYESLDQPLDISTVGFYKARMNYNPNAIKLIVFKMIFKKRKFPENYTR